MSERRLFLAMAITVAAASGAAVGGAGLKVEFPIETAVFKSGQGSDLTGQCLVCHSADYVTSQPPGMPLAFWKAEVEKMKKVYGAPIPEDQIDGLAQYFAQNYGDGLPRK